MSRQTERHEKREDAMFEINRIAGGEPRRARRAMARALGNRNWRNEKQRRLKYDPSRTR